MERQMISMKGKRGRPATGRNPQGHNGSYYIPDPNNFRNHLKKQEVERLINAYDFIHQMAFDVALSWSQKRDFRKDKIKGL
jgi:hypothetical protein